jgi:hypothetical protein
MFYFLYAEHAVYVNKSRIYDLLSPVPSEWELDSMNIQSDGH